MRKLGEEAPAEGDQAVVPLSPRNAPPSLRCQSGYRRLSGGSASNDELRPTSSVSRLPAGRHPCVTSRLVSLFSSLSELTAVLSLPKIF